MLRRRWWIFIFALLIVGVGLGLDDLAYAAMRPGGGGGFSGGGGGGFSGGGGGFSGGSSFGGSSYSSSSYSGGGGGGGDLGPVGWFFTIGFGLVFFVISVINDANKAAAWDSHESYNFDFIPVSAPSMRRKPVEMATLREHDPNFSQILLEDFLYELYARAQESRGSMEELGLLAPYLDAKARAELYGRGRRSVLAVSGVIVGSMQIEKFAVKEGWASIEVSYETNYTETYPSDEGRGQLGFYAKERWHFVRRTTAKSRKPDALRSFNCPSCAAPVDDNQYAECSHCGATHGTGEFDWLCNGIDLVREETRGPALVSNAPEVGTLSRTITDKRVDERLAELAAFDPEFDRKELFARVDMIYHELNAAWSSLQWDDAKPFLSDRLWLSWSYWIHAYEEQDLSNKMDKARITRREIAKVDVDPFFYSITVRIWASARDYTVHRKTGAVVCGKAGADRDYSEYWTFIRSAKCKGKASTFKNCPSCGAGLKIGMAGNCEFCGVKITGGEFDWVLSKIEQDESYRG